MASEWYEGCDACIVMTSIEESVTGDQPSAAADILGDAVSTAPASRPTSETFTGGVDSRGQSFSRLLSTRDFSEEAVDSCVRVVREIAQARGGSLLGESIKDVLTTVWVNKMDTLHPVVPYPNLVADVPQYNEALQPMMRKIEILETQLTRYVQHNKLHSFALVSVKAPPERELEVDTGFETDKLLYHDVRNALNAVVTTLLVARGFKRLRRVQASMTIESLTEADTRVTSLAQASVISGDIVSDT